MTEATAAPAVRTPAPGLLRRMACFVYEGLILLGIGLISGAIGAACLALSGPQSLLRSATALQLIGFVVYGVYFSWFWSQRGQTLPMQTWHIRLVRSDGRALSPSHALLRYVACWLWIAPAVLVARLSGWSGWAALAAGGAGVVVYALSSWLHPQRQFWHDALCGTRLISDTTGAKPAA